MTKEKAMSKTATAKAGDLWDNPMGTDGFEFVEFAAQDPAPLAANFERLGFTAIARHRSKDVTLYRQGEINFILNAEKGSFAHEFTAAHGPCVNAFAIRVKDAAHALERAVALGAEPVQRKVGPMELNIPAIRGIGGAELYLVDRYGQQSIYDVDFKPIAGVDQQPKGAGLTYIDHLTHNVRRGNMDTWAKFYERYFNFREVRYFDIEGKLTGLTSRAMTSPCGKIRIPINESSDDRSQIEEYLRHYRGEGVQHIALGAEDIIATVGKLKARGTRFLHTADTYYERVDLRVPGHGQDLETLRELKILVDGAPTEGQGLLLQIFTENTVGPIFFEIIQRLGNEGFGEGNFKALFQAMEDDQVRRGVLKAE
jgi:4-hydroxyphenylpyruvate dioxygenase